MKEDCLFVIIGATGDLAKKKLIPAIYKLLQEHKLNNFAVVGTSRDETTSKEILQNARRYMRHINEKVWKSLEKKFYYITGDFYDPEKWKILGMYLNTVEKNHKLQGNRLFFLATMPQHFSVIAENIGKYKLAAQKGNWARMLFEKPFGQDLASAKKINNSIKKVFKEEQIYRLDHYLGKELVQNVSVLKFTNMVIEPLLNNKYVDQVQIVLSEDFGITGRGAYYDKYGAIKDVVQNHVMQLLSLAAMESPKKLTGNYIRDEKVKVLKKVRTTNDVVLGQFEGYKKEKDVKKNSKTETFAALKLYVDTPRWNKTPFYVIAGKEMKRKITSIYIQFKQSPCLLFKKICGFEPNHLVIQIQPKEGFYLQLNAKAPGKTDITPVHMEFCHECVFGPNTPAAYENLFLDVIKGDQSAFIRTDEIEEQWKIIGKIKKPAKIYSYKKGSYPKEADKITKWHLKVK